MKVWVVHVPYEPTILGVFDSEEAAQVHCDDVNRTEYDVEDYVYVKEYIVNESL